MGFWEVFTNFGGTYYLFLIPVLLWCVDYRVGLRVLLVFVATLVLNAILKEAFAAPRPFEVDETNFLSRRAGLWTAERPCPIGRGVLGGLGKLGQPDMVFGGWRS